MGTVYGQLILTRKERQEILHGKQLTDLHVNAYQTLLKQRKENINGLQDTLLQISRPLPSLSGLTLQIIHVGSSHWATLRVSENDVYVYDSSYTSISTDTQNVIATLLCSSADAITAHIMNVSKQTGSTDCALFAMAYLTHLALGEDPTTVIFRQAELRLHLIKLLESGIVTTFPILKKRRQSGVHHSEKFNIYCQCRLPDTGKLMVCCDICSLWYHEPCIKDELSISKLQEETWACSKCKT